MTLRERAEARCSHNCFFNNLHFFMVLAKHSSLKPPFPRYIEVTIANLRVNRKLFQAVGTMVRGREHARGKHPGSRLFEHRGQKLIARVYVLKARGGWKGGEGNAGRFPRAAYGPRSTASHRMHCRNAAAADLPQVKRSETPAYVLLFYMSISSFLALSFTPLSPRLQGQSTLISRH